MSKEQTPMNSDRIREIQNETGSPNSGSVQQALLKVWNECEQYHSQQITAKVLEALEGFEREWKESTALAPRRSAKEYYETEVKPNYETSN